ncbi:MAG TPA: alpha/beta fold hydrolase, partial [Deltaproteobacteria bacterium]|nr:alpha/beta fold hydrolase [Deltaproteobacteria bacterium]
MRSKELKINSTGIPIKVWLFSPDTLRRNLLPAVVLCHGIPSSIPDPKDRGYMPLVESVVDLGFHCVFFNFRGCGDSHGNIDMEGWYEDLCAVLEEAYGIPGIDPSSLHLLGFSAGGAIAVKVAALDDRVKSVMTMATPANFSVIVPPDPDFLRQYFFEIGLIKEDSFPPDTRTWYDTFLELDTPRWISFVSPRNVCIVHGDKDTLVPVEHAKRIYSAAGRPK